jgi:broad specificity phosphatase PhoE
VLVLVRHGESAANAAGVLLGRTDSPLTDRGRQQVSALAAWFGPVTGPLVTSPLRRARATAEILGPDQTQQVDGRWIEMDYGELEGAELTTVPTEVWSQWRADVSYRPAGGESIADVGARVRDACEELFALKGDGARGEADVVVVSHVSPIKAAVAWALGAGDELAWHLHLSTASVTRIGWGGSGPVLHRYNHTVDEDHAAR